MTEVSKKKLLRFLMTGVLITGIHTVAAYLAIRYFESPVTVANGGAFILATVCSYTINTLWSFSSKVKGLSFFRFICVSCAGFSLAWSVSGTIDDIGLHYLIGILGVAITVPPVTFILHNFWTYR